MCHDLRTMLLMEKLRFVGVHSMPYFCVEENEEVSRWYVVLYVLKRG